MVVLQRTVASNPNDLRVVYPHELSASPVLLEVDRLFRQLVLGYVTRAGGEWSAFPIVGGVGGPFPSRAEAIAAL